MKIEYRIYRKKSSYDFKFDKNKNDFPNNKKNNMKDRLELIDVDTQNVLFSTNRIQTVANHPDMKLSDTMAPGKFQVKHFVRKGNFKYDIHGIINAFDIAGQRINRDSMQHDNGQYIGRWLIHTTYWPPLKRETSAYSGGCPIMSVQDLTNLNNALTLAGVKRNDVSDGILIEDE